MYQHPVCRRSARVGLHRVCELRRICWIGNCETIAAGRNGLEFIASLVVGSHFAIQAAQSRDFYDHSNRRIAIRQTDGAVDAEAERGGSCCQQRSVDGLRRFQEILMNVIQGKRKRTWNQRRQYCNLRILPSAALKPAASSNTACHRLLSSSRCHFLIALYSNSVGITERVSGGGGGATKGLVAIGKL